MKKTPIGWFWMPDGWKNGALPIGNWILYADNAINTQIRQKDLPDQMIFLYDASEKILVMGWEDIKRDQKGCDHEFNDEVFFESWNPITYLDPSLYAKIDANQKY